MHNNAPNMLDRVAEMVFAGKVGQSRLAAVADRYDQLVEASSIEAARLADPSGFSTARSDWALCDATLDGKPGGPTWAYMAMSGQLADVQLAAEHRSIASCFAGIFEIWPGRRTWGRDILSGVWLELEPEISAANDFVETPEPASVGLWELRVAISRAGARLLREPRPFPLALATELKSQRQAFAMKGPLPLPIVQGLRLRWESRGPRGTPRSLALQWFHRQLARELHPESKPELANVKPS